MRLGAPGAICTLPVEGLGLEQWWRTLTSSSRSRCLWTEMGDSSGVQRTSLTVKERWDVVRGFSSLSPNGCFQKTPAASTWSGPTAARPPSSSSSSVLQSWQCLSTTLCGSLRSSGWPWMKASGRAPSLTSLSAGRKHGALSPTCLSTLGKHGQSYLDTLSTWWQLESLWGVDKYTLYSTVSWPWSS